MCILRLYININFIRKEIHYLIVLKYILYNNELTLLNYKLYNNALCRFHLIAIKYNDY